MLIAFICITKNLEQVILTVCLRNIISLDTSYRERERDMIYYIFNLLVKQSGKIRKISKYINAVISSAQTAKSSSWFFVMGLLIID